VSYDVSIGSFDGNCTFNVSGLFFDHIPAERSRGGLHELHGLTGRQASAVLSQAFKRIHKTYMTDCRPLPAAGAPIFCARYDPPNGWGSTVSALIFLGELLGACADHPRQRVTVHA
jgi:hypothetical protein